MLNGPALDDMAGISLLQCGEERCSVRSVLRSVLQCEVPFVGLDTMQGLLLLQCVAVCCTVL